MDKMKKICFVMSDLRRVGPTKQTLNIIRYSGVLWNSIVVTLFPEPADSCIEDYQKAGINVICLNLKRSNVFLHGKKKLAKIVKDNGVKLIHSYGVIPDSICQIVSAKQHIEHLITLRNCPIEDAPTRMNPVIGNLVAFFHLHTLRKANHIITCSKSLCDKMKKKYAWANSFEYIQNGVDTYAYSASSSELDEMKIDTFNGTRKFISVASMIPRKRTEDILEVFRERENKKFLLVCLGDGPLMEGYKKECKENSNILLLGKKKDTKSYYQWADVFISASESEGMPNSVLESIACGTPVIVSNIPQHLEVLNEVPGAGWVFELGNISSLNQVINNLTDEAIDHAKECCKKILSSKLTMEKMACLYKEKYEDILSQHKK